MQLNIQIRHPGKPAMTSSHDLNTMRGYSLIEVLIAIVVLSIGLLGLAALQTIGMRFNHDSYGRTQAAFQVYDIIDRMRLNKASSGGVAHVNYDNVSFGATGTNVDCITNTCTSTQLSTDDIYTWKIATARLLPDGKAAICRGTFNSTYTSCTVATGTVYTIVVQWRENDQTITFETQTQL